VDALVLTGDLVHDASVEGYLRLLRQLSELEVPAYCLPGNHDDPLTLSQCLNGGGVNTTGNALVGDWNLVLLDSTRSGMDSGFLDSEQLEMLDASLLLHPDRHALICLHHQPVPVESAFMDSMRLENPDDLFSVIGRHPQVRGILWGHVHQAFAARWDSIGLYAAPSTCLQFRPGAERFELDEKPPGFRWLELYGDGRIESGVIRLKRQIGQIEPGADGY
jgi:Icc protein